MKTINIKNLFIYLSVVVLTFQPLFSKYVSSMFQYSDELIAVLCILALLPIDGIVKIDKFDIRFVILYSLLFVFGLIGNIIYDIQDSRQAILLDIFAMFKSIIIYMGIKKLYHRQKQCIYIIHNLAKIFRIYVYIMFLLVLTNLFCDIGMSALTVNGIRDFAFLFDGASVFALSFYGVAFIIILDVAMQDEITGKDLKMIFIVLLVWASTFVTRPIAYDVLLIGMYIIFCISKTKKVHLHNLIPIIVIVAVLGFGDIVFYFGGTSLTARSQLLIYGFYTLVEYFPIGSGFATYGSDMAYKHYSKLYTKYGFENVWGLAPNGEHTFANDSFWPEIMGQFGIIGVCIFVLIIVNFYKYFMSLNIKPTERLVLQWIMAVLFIGSIGTKTYIHYAIIPVFIVLALFSNSTYEEVNKIERI